MSGIYVHIPFCKSRCIYCGFYSTIHRELSQRYVDALCKELVLRKNYLRYRPSTIYIGGGTPSQLPIPLLKQIFNTIGSCRNGTEITMECNPEDVTPKYAEGIKSLRVNRVSMGAQTFDDSRLKFLKRRHKAKQVADAVYNLRQAGIRNISIDLMYGFPGETMDQWRYDIDQAISLNVEHLSAYSLMYEEGTTLNRMLQLGKFSETDEETSRMMYYELIDKLAAAGYEHYEISNFARKGYRSRHNSSYWQTVPYLGVGAAAHSFNIESRQWNVADINKYMASIERGEIPAERETLYTYTRYNDTVMLQLRTCEGIDIDAITTTFGSTLQTFCLNQAQRYITDGLLEQVDSHLRLTRKGLFVSDMVMSDLMKV